MPSLGTPISYHRLNRHPLDDMEVFNNLRDLMDYCNSGARYDGQRVAVLADNTSAASANKYTEYIINKNIPMIDMRGSEPIFRSLPFYGDRKDSHGLLIYEYNSDKTWQESDVFRLDEGALCLLNQLEIFRIGNSASGNHTYKFYMTRTARNTSTQTMNSIWIWSQNYNPFIDASLHTPESQSSISEISFAHSDSAWLTSNKDNIYLMPRTDNAVFIEQDFITQIYIKAEDYYNAWK